MKLRVRQLRKDKGWTIDQLAAVSGLSRGFISQLENEQRRPGPETLITLAGAFKISLSDLFDDQSLGDDLAAAMEILSRIEPEDRPAALRAMSGFQKAS